MTKKSELSDDGFESLLHAAGWQLLWELPWCSTCGSYIWAHTHSTADAGPRMFKDRDMDLYATLGLGPGPHSLRAVKSAFRRTIQAEHPDHGGNAERARRIIEVYDELRARGLAT